MIIIRRIPSLLLVDTVVYDAVYTVDGIIYVMNTILCAQAQRGLLSRQMVLSH